MERPDRRLDLAGELLEHQVLVLHLGDEAGRLEQPLAVPAPVARAVGAASTRRARRRPRATVSSVEGVLDVVHQPVVLGVEDLVDRVSAMFSLRGRHRRRSARRASRRRRCRAAGWRSRPGRACPRPAPASTGGVAGLWSVSCGLGRRCARCRSGTACRSAGRSPAPGPGLARLPSTSGRSVVTYCGRPRAGPGMNLPYGSVASIGMFETSLSDSCRPSIVAACFLTDAQVRHAGPRRVGAGRAAEQLAGGDRACRRRR